MIGNSIFCGHEDLLEHSQVCSCIPVCDCWQDTVTEKLWQRTSVLQSPTNVLSSTKIILSLLSSTGSSGIFRMFCFSPWPLILALRVGQNWEVRREEDPCSLWDSISYELTGMETQYYLSLSEKCWQGPSCAMFCGWGRSPGTAPGGAGDQIRTLDIKTLH